MEEKSGSLGTWLKTLCQKEGLSLREAATKTGLSHATVASIQRGENHVTAGTIRKLARAFGGDGHEGLALEDRLLILAGFRSERQGEVLSEPLGRLLDKMKGFSEPKLKLIASFADFLAEMEER
ncbi:helix-turn-helix domain-containing protein [Patescibacteria group bacterium]|nr:helix-turn-helix domain-containing protein [Patescibacteria group bacterium]